MRHWFNQLPESGESPQAVKNWETMANEMEGLEKRRKELKREFKKLDEELYKKLRKSWTLCEIYDCVRWWKAPNWWKPF